MVFSCWTIFGPTCVTAGFWTSWLSGILGLVVVTVIYCLPSQYRPTIICSWTWPKSCLFEHSLPELVQNEWNATVIGGKGSSLWSRNRGLSLSLSAIRVTENHSMIGQWRFSQAASRLLRWGWLRVIWSWRWWTEEKPRGLCWLLVQLKLLLR